MQLIWRRMSGPILITGTALAIVAIDYRVVDIPIPNPLVVTWAALGGILLVAGLLLRSSHTTMERERAAHATAQRLAAALDQTDIGVVLLDSDTRAEFINKAFRGYFALPDALAESKPPLIALMYHGRDTNAYQMPEHERDHFIARRTEMIRAGDSTPIDLRLSSGQVLRLNCKALPDGGRMLSYTPVTDLIRRDDDASQIDHYLALRQVDRSASARFLGAAE
jgi:PAS domain-containing protein